MNPQDRITTIIKYVLLILLIALTIFLGYQAHKYTGLYEQAKSGVVGDGLTVCPKTICPANIVETPAPVVSTPAPKTTTKPKPTTTTTVTEEEIYAPPAPPTD